MLYSLTPAAFLLVNLVLNLELFKNYGFIAKKQDKQNLPQVLYNWFLLTANCYFIVDIAWGILYQLNLIDALFPILYSITVFYFLFMLLTMLTWTKYIVAYIGRNGRRSNILLYGVWAMFVTGVICLMLNRFLHFIFYFNDAHEYIGQTGRNISFFLQITFYALLSSYMLYLAHKSSGHNKIRLQAVAATSIVLGLFLTFQIFFADYPFYSTGLMIGICLIHSFVQASEKKE